jgi:hypothetical protein
MHRGRIPNDDLHESLSEGEGACSGICDGRCVSRKAGVFSGSQTHRGKSQDLVAWIAGQRETESLKPIDEVIFRMMSKSSGRVAADKAANLAG